MPDTAETSRHGHIQVVLGAEIEPAYGRGRGGPGGWWIVSNVEVRLGDGCVVRPDLAGWNRERLQELPETAPVDVVPDWVCEIMSRATERRDRMERAALYLSAGVRHYRLVSERYGFIEVLERTEAPRWAVAGGWGTGDKPRIPPFTELELDLDAVFGTASA
ncbi:MAG: Uma2 family endonuclease [Acidobacteria bacterium]|nr:Uma2 family endonuclease [Acidobacteriota bacterium]